MKFSAVLGVLASAVLAVSAQAQIPGSMKDVEGWKVAAFERKDGGGFSHCSMFAHYRSGIWIYFTVFNNYTWNIGWSSETWRLTPGQQVDVVLSIDGAGPYTVTATARSAIYASAVLPGSGGLFDIVRRGNRMTVTAQSNTYNFNLTGTYAALTETANCVAAYGRGTQPAPPPIMGAQRGPQTDSVPKASPPQPMPPQAVPAQAAPTQAAPTQATMEQRLEATKLIANILAQGDMPGGKILTAAEIADLKSEYFSSSDVVWKADGVVGTLRILTKSKASATDHAANVLATDARFCKGSFASGSSPDDKNPKVLRLFAACQTPQKVEEYNYTLVPLTDGTYYLFASAYISEPGAPRGKAAATQTLMRQAVYEMLKQ